MRGNGLLARQQPCKGVGLASPILKEFAITLYNTDWVCANGTGFHGALVTSSELGNRVDTLRQKEDAFGECGPLPALIRGLWIKIVACGFAGEGHYHGCCGHPIRADWLQKFTLVYSAHFPQPV